MYFLSNNGITTLLTPLLTGAGVLKRRWWLCLLYSNTYTYLATFETFNDGNQQQILRNEEHSKVCCSLIFEIGG